MAYDFMNQAMGFGPGAFETEEERRKRLEREANTEVQSQTVKTYGDGTQETITKTTTGPVAPQDLTGAVRTAESGGRDFDQAGRPLTSPKGAMFGMQVMPSTAANPGFGIRPAADQSPEEYNRVGQEYLAAMQKRYPNQPEAAIAAYNMGPGAVDRNIAQNQGQFNLGQAPGETQKYVPRVMSMAEKALSALVPSAQAAPAPVAPTVAQPPARIVPPGQTVNLADSRQTIPTATAPATPVAPGATAETMPYSYTPPESGIIRDEEGNIVNYAPGVAPTVTTAAGAQLPARGVEIGQAFGGKFLAAQNDNDKLAQLAGDQTASPFERQLAKDMFVERYKANEQESRAQKIMSTAIQTGNFNEVTREMRKEGGLGDWLKYMFFKSNGFTEAANETADRLGITDTFQTVTLPDGTQATVRFGTSGLAKSGINSAGQDLTQDQLNSLTGGMLGKQVTTSGTFFQTKDGQILRAQSDDRGRVRLVDAASGQTYTGSTAGLTKLEEAGALRKMDYGLVTDLKKKHGQNVLEAEKDYVAINGPFKTDAERQQFRSAYGFGQALPAGQTVPTTPGATTTTTPGATTTPAAPAAPVAPGSQITKPIEEQKATTQAQKDIAKDSAKVVADAPEVLATLRNVDNAIKLTSQKNNLGTIAQGTLPGERAVGRMISSKDQRNTDNIIAAVKELSAKGMKALGANPTDADRDYLTANIPDETWDAESVREWLRDRRKFVVDKIEIAKKQVKSGGTFEPTVPEAPPEPGEKKPTVSNW